MNTHELIQPTPVIRDARGFWSHPGIPNFDEDHTTYKAWLKSQGLVTCPISLESEDESHPAYQRYFEDQVSEVHVNDWNPESPKGEGWFVLWIDDTENGPYFVWARRGLESDSEGDLT